MKKVEIIKNKWKENIIFIKWEDFLRNVSFIQAGRNISFKPKSSNIDWTNFSYIFHIISMRGGEEDYIAFISRVNVWQGG